MTKRVEIKTLNHATIIQSEWILTPDELEKIKKIWDQTLRKESDEAIFIGGIYLVDLRSNTPTN
jgi:hypothetical protein